MVAMSFLQFSATKCAQLRRIELSSQFSSLILITGVTSLNIICTTTRSHLLNRRKRHSRNSRRVFESFRNVFGASVILTMVLKMYAVACCRPPDLRCPTNMRRFRGPGSSQRLRTHISRASSQRAGPRDTKWTFSLYEYLWQFGFRTKSHLSIG